VPLELWLLAELWLESELPAEDAELPLERLLFDDAELLLDEDMFVLRLSGQGSAWIAQKLKCECVKA
jgi:hypothetical protein